MLEPSAFRTDGKTPVTQEELNAHMTWLHHRAQSASVAEVEKCIACDRQLAAAGISVAADEEFNNWVVVTFPHDEETPKFWALAAKQIIREGGKYFDGTDPRLGQTQTPYQVRQDKQLMCDYLSGLAREL